MKPRGQGPSDLVRYSHLGIQFALVVLLGIFLGVRLDRKLGTGSILTLVGTFVGAGIGFYVLYRETSRSQADPRGPGTGDGGAGGSSRDPDGPDGGP